MEQDCPDLSRALGEEGGQLQEGLQHGGMLPQPCQDDPWMEGESLYIAPLCPEASVTAPRLSRLVQCWHATEDSEHASPVTRLSQ